jgi:autotransporter-associated beta strand protein
LGSAATVVRVDGGIFSPVTLNGRVRGGVNGLTKVGTGRLHLAGNNSNDYMGTTRVNQGVLVLAKAAGVNAVSGPLVVGDAAVVRLFADDQIADTRAVTVEGTLDLDGHDETLGPITFNSGTILPDGGTLTMNGNVTTAGANNAIGEGTLDLNGLTRTFTVANGVSPVDLNVVANIVGTGAGVTKNGAGKLRFTGTNTYTGQTLIQAGALEIDGDQPQSAVVVESLGTLEGNGRVGATQVRGTVRPGPNNDSLTINSDVTFVPSMNTIFAVDMHRDVKTAGKLIARTATISGTNLAILDNVNDLPPIGSPVIIMGARSGLSGRFKGVPNNSTVVSSSGVTYRVNYTSTLVYVTRVTGP